MEDQIEFCINKSSGKYFIYIQHSGEKEALLITPLGEIKSLNMDLFELPEENDANRLLSEGLVTEKQIERWKLYNEYRAQDKIEHAQILAEQCTIEQLEQLLNEWEQEKKQAKS